MKIINTETLIQKEISVPDITGIYDPLSKQHDGTVTPQAPIIVSGNNLNMFDLSCIRLCLAPALDCHYLIDVLHVYKYSCNMVIASLPALSPGEYFPAVRIINKDGNGGEDDSVYILPVSLIVKPLRHSI